MRKRVISILVIAMLMLSCVACEKSNSFTESYIDEIDFSDEPVTITYLTIGDKPSNGMTEKVIDALNKILVRDLNAKLDVYYVSWNDYLYNYNKVLSSGEIDIDLVGISSDWLDAWSNVVEGNYYPLNEEMIHKYCPETYSNVTSTEWSKCKYNGNIYFIPENEYTQWTNHGFAYRKDIAMEMGLDGINSWEDLDCYFRKIADDYPEMIAWDADGTNSYLATGYFMSKGKYRPISELGKYNIWGAYSDDMYKIVSPYYEGEEFVEFAKMMKAWNDAGVWRNDLTNSEDNDGEFYAGFSGAIQHHTEMYYTEIKPNMDIMSPDAQIGFYWFGKESGNIVRNSIIHGGMAVYAKSRNPERALMVYDYIRNNEECYRLVRYGIEGLHYEEEKNGMLEKPSGYNAEKNDYVLNYWWGRRDEFELQNINHSWKEYNELVDEYNKVAIDYPWDSVPFSTPEINEEISPIIEIFDKYIPEITYGKYEISPEEEVAKFREELKAAGMNKVTNKLQTRLNSY